MVTFFGLKNIKSLLVLSALLFSISLDAVTEKQKEFIYREFDADRDTHAVEALVNKNFDIEQETYFNDCWYRIHSILYKHIYKNWVCVDLETDQVVGFLFAMEPEDVCDYESLRIQALEPKDFYIRAIGVDKDYRGCGIASKLLRKAYTFAKKDITYTSLTITASNTIAQKCYEKFGFTFDAYNNGTLPLQQHK